MQQALELRIRHAVDDGSSHGEFLYRVPCAEVERRDGKQLELGVCRASFEHARTLEDFDFHFHPRAPKARGIDLAKYAFIDTHRRASASRTSLKPSATAPAAPGTKSST